MVIKVKNNGPKPAKMKVYWLTLFGCGLLFSVLLLLKTGTLKKWAAQDRSNIEPVKIEASEFQQRDDWMNIIQADRKIGYAHNRMRAENDGYRVDEEMRLRINTAGMIQDVRLKTVGYLNSDMTLELFEFEMDSGRFRFQIKGRWRDGGFEIESNTDNDGPKSHIKLDRKPHYSGGIVDAVKMTGLTPGKQMRFTVFDPATMGKIPVVVTVVGKEQIERAGSIESATKLTMDFKGTTQSAWLNSKGELVKQAGILGLVLEKTSANDALYGGSLQASQDLVAVAAVKPDKTIQETARLAQLVLEIDGLEDGWKEKLTGGRQQFKQGLLVITREVIEKAADAILEKRQQAELEKYLKPEAFIQSDHPHIKKLAEKIVSKNDAPLKKVRRLMAWIDGNIAKRPVVSVPDAVTTLKNRVGDCNEHAVLFAALARAAGLPANVEAGLVYVRGSFYYHAWNRIYLINLGKWVTVDALFKQFPADVTHIRLVTGAQKEQLDIMGLIGRIKIKVIEQISS